LNVLGLIPARGGSKSIPDKNITPLRGRPLITYAIDAARASRALTRTIVSTDDATIAKVARDHGGSVPFLRPSELASDESPMLPVIQHAVSWLAENEAFKTDVVVLLQPTSPLRRSEDIDAAVDLLISRNADTVVSVVDVPHQFTPSSLMEIRDGWLISSAESLTLRRQDKPRLYARNGPAVLVVRTSIIANDRLYGDKTLPLLMPRERSIDIDDPADLALAEFWLNYSCNTKS
jgi:CMP-N-acetylneuraminic acid synthetase